MALLGRQLNKRAVQTGRDSRTLLVAGRHRSTGTRSGREHKEWCGSMVHPRALPPNQLLNHSSSSLSRLGLTPAPTTPGLASGHSGGEKVGSLVVPTSGRNLGWRPGLGSRGYSRVAVVREGEHRESRIAATSRTAGRQVRNPTTPPFAGASSTQLCC